MKYKVMGSDLMHDGVFYPEGSEIELTDKEAKKLEHCIEKIEKGGKEK